MKGIQILAVTFTWPIDGWLLGGRPYVGTSKEGYEPNLSLTISPQNLSYNRWVKNEIVVVNSALLKTLRNQSILVRFLFDRAGWSDRPVCKCNPSVLLNWESCSSPNCSSLKSSRNDVWLFRTGRSSWPFLTNGKRAWLGICKTRILLFPSWRPLLYEVAQSWLTEKQVSLIIVGIFIDVIADFEVLLVILQFLVNFF